MNRFLKLQRVRVEGPLSRREPESPHSSYLDSSHTPEDPLQTVDVLLNVDMVLHVLSDDGAETAIVTTIDNRRMFVSAEQAEQIESIALGRVG
jgi:hypothetical protein